jgi:hypothetical protein
MFEGGSWDKEVCKIVRTETTMINYSQIGVAHESIYSVLYQALG